MTDFHRNVFYYYRGAQRSNKDRDSQLENNTTKALINTLDHCGDAVALRFLDWLGIKTAGQVKYELQKATTGDIGNQSQRLLLGIVPAKEEDNPCAEEVAAGSSGIPDAWLYGDDYIVLIESKVRGSLEPEQMRRHLQKLRAGTAQQPEYKVRTWPKVHRFFKALPDELKDVTDLDTWLIGQFTQYLEWIGMAEFTGLEQGMFDYFATRPDSRDDGDRQWVRGTMQSFAEKVLERLQSIDSLFYESYHVGRLWLKDDHCWAAFGPRDAKFKQQAHQTMSLYEDRLDVFVNVELKRAVEKLRKKIRQDRQAFREVMLRLPAPFTVQLEERKQKVASQFDYHIVARLETGNRKDPTKLGEDEFDYIENFLERTHLPCLSVRRSIDRNHTLDLSQGDGQTLVDEVVGIMREFHWLVEFING